MSTSSKKRLNILVKKTKRKAIGWQRASFLHVRMLFYSFFATGDYSGSLMSARRDERSIHVRMYWVFCSRWSESLAELSKQAPITL